MKTIRIADRALQVRDEGSGPAVLLIHGMPTNAELWREVVPELARHSRVIVPDLLGYGRSERPRGAAVDIEAQAGYLLELLDQLEVERATVVGHDVGGGVAQILAVHYPERVERLGLVNSVCYDAWPVPEMRAIQLAAPVVERLPAKLTAEGIRMGLRRGFLHQDRAERYLEAFLEPFSAPEGLEVFVEHARSLDSGSTERLAPRLRELRMPVAVVWGRHDPFLEPRWAERLAGDIPTAGLTWVEASHFSPADAPSAVAGALAQLLHR